MSKETVCVFGASISGMLISKVLAKSYKMIYLIDKRSTCEGNHRFDKELPQASHVHILLNKGLNELDKILPGIENDLIQAGGIKSNSTKNWWSYFPFGKFPDYQSKLEIVCVSRSLLENTIRHRILHEEPSIQFVDNANVINYTLSGTDKPTVTYNGEMTQTIEVDLLIDATGQHSHADKVLKDHGFGSVNVETIDPKLGYASRKYKDIPFDNGKHGILVMPKDPEIPRGGVVFPIENNEYMVTLYGFDKEQPINKDFDEFARSLSTPTLYDHIKSATALTETKQYVKKESHYKKYHQLSQWPKGYLVIGDAVCSFNPIYGQGITASVCSINNIQKQIVGVEPSSSVCKSMQKTIDNTYFIPWTISKNEDLRWDSTEGAKKTFLLSLMHKFMNKVIRIATVNPVVTEAFIGILHMSKSPLELFKPKVIKQIIKGLE